MAMNTEPNVKNNLAVKVEGDLGDLQIIEESSSSDDDDCVNETGEGSRKVQTLPYIPQDLVTSTTSPVIGSVAVTNSDNVQFGNNTYFNGPVTIKQIIQPGLGIENASYTKTDEENTPHKKYKSKDEKLSIQKFKIQTWHKLTFSAICVIVIGGLSAVIVVMQSTSSLDMPLNNNQDSSNSSSNHIKVMGLCVENFQVNILSIILIALTLLLMYLSLLLTKKVGDGGQARDAVAGKNKISIKNVMTISYNNNIKANKLFIAPGVLRIVSRTDWLAQPVEQALDRIRHPVPWVIITHTATESCHSQSACVLRVRLIQTFHIESRGWYDIGYNFLVGGDGSAYYGRGWDYVGAHTMYYNKYSIGIAFIGTFNTESPTRQQVEACKKLLKQGVDEGKLDKNYKLFGHRQLMSTLSPGDKVFDLIEQWPHFVGNYTEDLVPKY